MRGKKIILRDSMVCESVSVFQYYFHFCKLSIVLNEFKRRHYTCMLWSFLLQKVHFIVLWIYFSRYFKEVGYAARKQTNVLILPFLQFSTLSFWEYWSVVFFLLDFFSFLNLGWTLFHLFNSDETMAINVSTF